MKPYRKYLVSFYDGRRKERIVNAFDREGAVKKVLEQFKIKAGFSVKFIGYVN